MQLQVHGYGLARVDCVIVRRATFRGENHRTRFDIRCSSHSAADELRASDLECYAAYRSNVESGGVEVVVTLPLVGAA